MISPDSAVYSGTSGLMLPVPKLLYPAEFQGKSRLTYYASLFNSIEINSSFYKMPMLTTVDKWADSAPDHFQFTFKLSKTVTHARGLDFNQEDINKFIQTINRVGYKKGCLLVQFPPGLKIENKEQVEKLMISIQNADPDHLWKVAIEFRNKSWYNQDVYDLLNQYAMSMVIHDLPASATPLDLPTGNFIYMRFHGPDGRYRGSYSDDFLNEYSRRISAWKAEAKVVYVYFNNTMGDAVQNLNALNNAIQI